MRPMASQIPTSRLFTQPFIRAQKIKENIKAPRHFPLCGEFTGDRWIPRTNGQQRGNCFHLMTSPCRNGCRCVHVSMCHHAFLCLHPNHSYGVNFMSLWCLCRTHRYALLPYRIRWITVAINHYKSFHTATQGMFQKGFFASYPNLYISQVKFYVFDHRQLWPILGQRLSRCICKMFGDMRFSKWL